MAHTRWDIDDVLAVSCIAGRVPLPAPSGCLVRATQPVRFEPPDNALTKWGERFPYGNLAGQVMVRTSTVLQHDPTYLGPVHDPQHPGYDAERSAAALRALPHLWFALPVQDVRRNMTMAWRSFWEQHSSAYKIQRAWRKAVLSRRAAARIQAAFRAWHWRRQVLWNPHTPLGREYQLQLFRKLCADV